jgi:hypothetical protein
MTPRHQTRRYLSQPMSSPIVRQIGEALFPARPTTPLVQRGCRTLVPCQTALEDTRSVDATSAWQPRPSQLHSEAWRPPPLELSGDAANGFRYSMRPLPEPTPPLLPSRLGHHIGSPAHVSNRRARAQPQASRSPVLASQLGAAPLFDTLHCTVEACPGHENPFYDVATKHKMQHQVELLQPLLIWTFVKLSNRDCSQTSLCTCARRLLVSRSLRRCVAQLAARPPCSERRTHAPVRLHSSHPRAPRAGTHLRIRR